MGACAKSKENQIRGIGYKQKAHYSVPPEQNAQLWTEIERTINDPEKSLGHFRDAFIFFDVKNIKTEAQAHDLYEAMEKFDEKLLEYFDEEYVSQMALDLGLFIGSRCPSPSVSNSGYPAVTYLWKKCCVEDLHAKLIKEGFNNSKGNYSVYNVGNLGDIFCLTVEPPKKSTDANGGLCYIQAYSQAKILTEAQGIYPLQDESLKELAVRLPAARRGHLVASVVEYFS
ncbi:hypothetical protein BU24DRAFT_484017 [Aaosphaeria arxii CBS 175.79]|uniref:Uncharacterized protein n=1 Tax=Aaosphaeria arxii CBS 175.79 TaxID=1450172 RepID=A0A6A5XLD9_9PLEO|nr:uncharacterized protein BU24DRAFT_484017 [Aaosphaeria arxii CBS 175.79]KAF2014085.1 hypothetical protein BU24DRAFT_484017 [Aaosphaeria arxii CBS 175.79]